MRKATTTRARRFFAPLIAVLMLGLSVVVLNGPTASADTFPTNFYICHATGQASSAEEVKHWVVNRPANQGQFDGHVGSGTNGDHQNSLDIIPPIPELNFAGQNWTEFGQE